MDSARQFPLFPLAVIWGGSFLFPRIAALWLHTPMTSMLALALSCVLAGISLTTGLLKRPGMIRR